MKGVLAMANNQLPCSYCGGQGYQDVLIGGSETCPACEGTGKGVEKK